MDERGRPCLQERLHLAESLLRVVEDSAASLQRLASTVHTEVELLLREEVESARDEEVIGLRREVDQLREGLASRAVIEQAKGMLMQRHGITDDEAFQLLNELSQRRRRKLRDIAADVARGSLPPHLAVLHGDTRPEHAARQTARRPDGSRHGTAEAASG